MVQSHFMLKKPKFIPKSTLVIIALVVLNLIVFLAVSSGINISHKHRTTDNIITNADDNNYFKAGVNVLDWSYALLRYFNK
jgi:ABC-type lipoprotein release transport system permease subunit